jgi:uncharacterized protein
MLVAAAACRAPAPERAFDHHVHVLGPRLVSDWKSLGVPFSRPDEAYTSAARCFEGPDALAGAWLVPMGHLYANAEFARELGLDEAEARARLRAENAHVAREAARLGPPSLACVSVPPLAPWALEELAHGTDVLGARALKLHLASGGVDLREPAHLEAVGRCLDAALERGLPVLLHLDPQLRGHAAEDVGAALDVLLGPRDDLVVVIAHLGGSGGFGPWTRSVLATLTEWLASEAGDGRLHSGVLVDVSAVILAAESEGVPPTSAEELEQLAPALRRLGLGRVLFASDAPVFAPADTQRLWRERSGLTSDEWSQVLANRP